MTTDERVKLTKPQRAALESMRGGDSPYVRCPIRARGALTNTLWHLRQKGLVRLAAGHWGHELTDAGREALGS